MTSQAQSAQTTQAALSTEVGTLSDKFTGLARVMAGHYDWKPAQGARSVGEVFNLIVVENGILAGTLTGATSGERPAPIGDPPETSGSAQGLLRQPAADGRAALRRRSEGPGEIVRTGDDEGGRNPVSVRRPARAPRTVDCLRALERRRSAVVEVGSLARLPRATSGDYLRGRAACRPARTTRRRLVTGFLA